MTCGISIGEGCLDEGYRGWEKIIEKQDVGESKTHFT